MILWSDEHPQKRYLSSFLIKQGRVILERLLQLINAPSLIHVTLFGMLILLRLMHPWKAPFSIVWILSGISILLTNLSLKNADSPIFVTPSGIVIFVSD